MKNGFLKKNLIIFTVMNLSLILFATVYTLLFSHKGDSELFSCVFKETFGLYCPGCGGSRSLSAFMRLDFLSSFILYPPIIISALAVLSYDARLILSLIYKNDRFTSGYRFFIFLSIPVSVFLTFIIRNILLLFFKIDTVGDFL